VRHLIVLISIIIFPIFVFGQVLTNGEEFYDDESRAIQDDPAYIQNQGNTGARSSRSGSASQAAQRGIDDTGDSFGATDSYQFSDGGGIEGADAAGSSGSGVQMRGMIMGAAFAAQCGPQNPMACVAAAMSFMDAGAGSDARGYANDMINDIDPYSAGGGPGGSGDDVRATEIQRQLKNLSELGYQVNPDGSVTGPNGENYTKEDLSSEQALQARGLTPAQASQFMNDLGEIRDNAIKEAGNPDEIGQAVASTAGAGGGGGPNYIGGNNGSTTIVEEVEIRDRRKKRGLASAEAAKLSKNFHGDPIGISIANIFQIVHLKYKEKNKKKTEFINKEY
jgi:hypothetical protein